MQYISLVDGKKYALAPGGVIATDERVALKLSTDETIEEVTEAFNADNTTCMLVLSEDGVTLSQIKDFIRRGSVMKKTENAVIGTTIIPEETDEEGNVITESSLEEVYGPVISFNMYKERIEDRITKCRADIDYLLMMEEG